MARWVKSKQSMRIFKTSTTPTALDGLTVGDIWIDTTSGAVEKVCTSISPVTFSTNTGTDGNGNDSVNNVISGYTTTATAAATTTLTAASTRQQFFTGSTTQTVKLPVTSTLALGFQFEIVNNSSGVVTVQSSGSNTIVAMAAATKLLVTCILTSGTTAASWDYVYEPNASGITGSGSLVRATAPTLNSPVVSGTITGSGGTWSNTGNISATGQLIGDNRAGSAQALLVIYPDASSKGAWIQKATQNSGNFNITMTNAAYGQDTTLTVPDPGASTANFILSAGTQSIANGLTVTTPNIVGTTTNNNAAAGSVGEYVSSVVSNPGATGFTSSGTAQDLTSISLTAGDWDVWGNVTFIPNSTTAVSSLYWWISTTSATQPDASLLACHSNASAGIVAGNNYTGGAAPQIRLSLSGTTTVYISANANFTVSTMGFCGGIYARRVR